MWQRNVRWGNWLVDELNFVPYNFISLILVSINLSLAPPPKKKKIAQQIGPDDFCLFTYIILSLPICTVHSVLSAPSSPFLPVFLFLYQICLKLCPNLSSPPKYVCALKIPQRKKRSPEPHTDQEIYKYNFYFFFFYNKFFFRNDLNLHKLVRRCRALVWWWGFFFFEN